MSINQGVPKTSLEALEKGETILFETIPKEFWYLGPFAPFPFSKNWSDEIKTAKNYIHVVKRRNRPLHKFMTNS